MKLFNNPWRLVKMMMTLVGLAGAVGALWWGIFALKPYEISPADWTALYAHAQPASPTPQMQLGAAEPVQVGQTPAWAQSLRYTGFDGSTVLATPDELKSASVTGKAGSASATGSIA
jgi:hypothetical protein